MHKEDIKSVLRKKHGTLAAFEQARGLPAGSVKDALRGRSIARTQAAIAVELKKPLQELFPKRYGDREPSTKVDELIRDSRSSHRLTVEVR